MAKISAEIGGYYKCTPLHRRRSRRRGTGGGRRQPVRRSLVQEHGRQAEQGPHGGRGGRAAGASSAAPRGRGAGRALYVQI